MDTQDAADLKNNATDEPEGKNGSPNPLDSWREIKYYLSRLA
jgi:hypothetical protein